MFPTLFVAHGAPSLVLEDNDYTRQLKALGETQFAKPKAVIIFSAHWITKRPTLSIADPYETIHDFSHFPSILSKMRYPASTDVGTARRVEELFGQNGIPFDIDIHRGLDHGAWVVLQFMYPAADIPVVSMSVTPSWQPRELYQIGHALARLREEGILIIASGGTVHNLTRLDWQATQTEPWAREFDLWLEERLSHWDLSSLYRYDALAPHAQLAVPPGQNEHFVPIFYTMGAATDTPKATLRHRSYQYGHLSHSIWQFG